MTEKIIDRRVADPARFGGVCARRKGYPKSACPYPNHEVTMSFRRAWFEGWDEEDREMKESAKGGKR
jgi:ribosome modulation factor